MQKTQTSQSVKASPKPQNLNPPKPPVKIGGRTENREATAAQGGPLKETALTDFYGRLKGRLIPTESSRE